MIRCRLLSFQPITHPFSSCSLISNLGLIGWPPVELSFVTWLRLCAPCPQIQCGGVCFQIALRLFPFFEGAKSSVDLFWAWTLLECFSDPSTNWLFEIARAAPLFVRKGCSTSPGPFYSSRFFRLWGTTLWALHFPELASQAC